MVRRTRRAEAGCNTALAICLLDTSELAANSQYEPIAEDFNLFGASYATVSKEIMLQGASD